jgi:RNA polymerase sigma factor for flagellar operon FliA
MDNEMMSTNQFIPETLLINTYSSRRISARAVKEVLGEATQDTVILEHMPIVRHVARSLHRQLPEHIETEDLVSEGVLGLMDACRTFRSDKNVEFRSYAQFRVRGAMLDSLRAMDCASRSLRRRERAAKEAIRALAASLKRMPDEAEIAKELGVSVPDYQRLRNDLAQITVLPLEDVNGSPSDRRAIDEIPAQAAEDPGELCLRTELREAMVHALDALPEREKLVITLFYYEELSMAEIAKTLGVVRSRVSQIHAAGLLHLRAALSALNVNAHQA